MHKANRRFQDRHTFNHNMRPANNRKSNITLSLETHTTCMEALDWIRTRWRQMTTADFSLDNYEGALKYNQRFS